MATSEAQPVPSNAVTQMSSPPYLLASSCLSWTLTLSHSVIYLKKNSTLSPMDSLDLPASKPAHFAGFPGRGAYKGPESVLISPGPTIRGWG